MAPCGPFIEGHATDQSSTGWSTNEFLELRNPAGAQHGLLWSELNGHAEMKHSVTQAVRATLGIVVLDAKDVYDALHNRRSTTLGLVEKRGVELLGRKDSTEEHDYLGCHSDIRVADGIHRDGIWCWTPRTRQQRHDHRWESFRRHV